MAWNPEDTCRERGEDDEDEEVYRPRHDVPRESEDTVPYVENRRGDAQLEHEATTTKLSDDQLFYARQRGIGEEEAVALLVNGFVRDVLQKLPMEFAVEAQKLLEVSLEGSVG